MTNRDIIVAGASAGGVQALSDVVASLPADLPAAVFAVLHLNPHAPSMLPGILKRSSRLPVVHPKDGEPIWPGRVYVAPPDFHLAIECGKRIRLTRGATENGHRPAVDVLFRTAAKSCGARVIGVILTGNLDDGTAGLSEVKRCGGIAVVQDPEEADYPGMPASALRNVDVDHVLPLAEIGPLLDRLSREPLPPGVSLPKPPGAAEQEQEWEAKVDELDGASGLTCPSCGGALWQSPRHPTIHFRCRTGHAFSPESLAASQAESLEAALWAALRSLEESAALSRRMENRLREAGRERSTGLFGRRAEVAEKHAGLFRTILAAAEEPEGG